MDTREGGVLDKDGYFGRRMSARGEGWILEKDGDKRRWGLEKDGF